MEKCPVHGHGEGEGAKWSKYRKNKKVVLYISNATDILTRLFYSAWYKGKESDVCLSYMCKDTDRTSNIISKNYVTKIVNSVFISKSIFH